MRHRVLLLVAIAACTSSRPPADDDVTPDAAEVVADAPMILPDGTTILPDGVPPPPGTGDAFAELANVDPKCRNGWCWWSPKPAGIGYQRLFHTGPDNIWLTGGFSSNSIVLQWNGTKWIVHTPQPADLPGPQPQDGFIWSIGGSGPTNMWMLYGGTVQQWDGVAWTVMDTFHQSMSHSYNSVWVDPTGVPWITTSHGKVRRYINGAWDEMSVGCDCMLGTIFGTDVNDVFIAMGGAILRFDGQSFQFVYTGKTLGWFQGVKRDVWASGDNTIAHWDGETFTVVPHNLPGSRIIQRIGWLATDDAWWWAGGFLHWDGVELSHTPLDQDASFEDDCCPGVMGDAAIIDGTWWMAGGEGGIYTKVSPTTVKPVVKVLNLGSNIWGTSIDDVYFGATEEIRHWNGSTWTTIPIGARGLVGVPGGGALGNLEMFGLSDIRDSSTNEWVSTMVHFDGLSWLKTELARGPFPGSTAGYLGIVALGPGEALLVGYGGKALYYHDGAFELVSTGTTVDLGCIWAPSPDHAYIVGASGTVLEWKRANPTVMTPDPTFPAPTITDPFFDLIAVTGAGGVAWVTQQNGTTAWRKPPDGPWQAFDFHATASFHGWKLVAIDATSAIIFGNDSTSAARFDGTQFNYEQIPYGGVVSGAYALPDGNVIAVGNDGVIVRAP